MTLLSAARPAARCGSGPRPGAAVEPIDWHGRPACRLRGADGACVRVAAHGAQVLSWTGADGRERLYRPPQPPARPDQPLRGGVPVVFPQFGAAGPLPKHGFARDRRWAFAAAGVEHGAPLLRLVLDDDATTRALWPHAFRATLAVRLQPGALELRLSVLNTGDAAFSFTAALHSYLAVDRSAPPRIGPLEGRRLSVDGAVDRVFAGAGPCFALRHAGGGLVIEHDGFPDLVLWNPGPDGAAALPDLPDADWRAMLCVEAARVARPVRLAPGQGWRGRQRLVG